MYEMREAKHEEVDTRGPENIRIVQKASFQQPKSKYVKIIYESLKDTGISCKFIFASGEILCLGQCEPELTVTFHSDSMLKKGFDEYSLGQAYISGEIEIEGSMPKLFEIRKYMKGEITFFFMLKMWLSLLFCNPININRDSIAQHYSFGDDFYLTFVDCKYHLYSHCLFQSDSESLEEAADHKMKTMAKCLKLKSGMRLLDIGAGWGAVTRFAGPRDIHVIALTIHEDSYKLHRDLIAKNNLPNCEIHLEDFLEHNPEEPYDAIVIFGVIEHIPQYRRFTERVWNCLKPGGRIYLDASSVLEKYNVSNFVRKYIYPGTHTYLCLQELIMEFLMHGFKVLEVVDETYEYELTLRHWAQRLEANQGIITRRWGEKVFRSFHLYLWGGFHAMRRRDLQAYHIVAERTEDPGIRPGLFKRTRYFIRSLT
ncbi:class I SAM-dependent methyltransferase [Thermodesulfobacteriota bacterium]